MSLALFLLSVQSMAGETVCYRDVLGLEQIDRPNLSMAGVWFRMGDRELHLIGDRPDEPNRQHSLDTSHPHFAIRVTSYAGARAELGRLGFREDVGRDDPNGMMALPNSVVGYPQLYILDPDGHMIEINAERLDGASG